MVDQNGKISGDGDHDFKGKKYNYNNEQAELNQVRIYLSENNASSTMVATALNIYRPNLTRYKSMLQDAGLLVVTHRAPCKETGRTVDYLSCDPVLVKGGANGQK